jgi:uncharacterized membrane protein YfcA
MSVLEMTPAALLRCFAFGVVAALLGVAGGRLLIPTPLLLFGADIKQAGSLSRVPTTRFARHGR